MNYDESLLYGQYTKDETGDLPEKIWVIFDKGGSEILDHSTDEEQVRNQFEMWKEYYATTDDDYCLEFGWVWDDNGAFDAFTAYRVAEIVEASERGWKRGQWNYE